MFHHPANRSFPKTFAVAFALLSASWIAQAQETYEMKEVVVQAEEEQGYLTPNSSTATKTDTPLMDTPVSVQSISQQVMEEQQVLNLDDALQNVSGVYANMGPDGNTMDAFIVRGFASAFYGSVYLDGVKNFARSPKEMANLESVDVLKGPAAILYGRIEPGGLINQVSKKPQKEAFTEIQQQIGDHDFFRTVADSTGPVGERDDLLYRTVLVYEDSESYRDYTYNKRFFVAPQMTWTVSDSTEVNFGVEYLDDDRSWAQTYGTVAFPDGSFRVPIETNLFDKDDNYTEESIAWRLNWDHQFNDQWTLRQRLTYVDRSSVAQGSWIDPPDSLGNYQRTYWGWDNEESTVLSTNLELWGKLETDPVKHSFLIGADYFDEDYDSGGWAGGGTPTFSNVFNPTHDSFYDLDYTVDPYWYQEEFFGVYVQDQMALLDDQFHILLGARYDDSYYAVNYAGVGGAPENESVTWRAGALYQLRETLSVYASYVEGFGRANFDWITGETFDPETSHQMEVGAKLEFSSRLGMTLALYELTKDNLVVGDPENPLRTILAGEAVSRGLEFDLTGKLTPEWELIFAYAYTDTEWTSDPTLKGESFIGVPEHGASLWSTYEVSNWTFGGGLVYRGERLGIYEAWLPSLYPWTMDAYTVADAMIEYDTTLFGLDTRFQLNVGNLFDKEYYPTSYYGSLERVEVGNPRSFLFSAKVKL